MKWLESGRHGAGRIKLITTNRYTVTVFNTDCIHMHTAYVKECTVANTSRKFHSQGNAMQQAYFKRRK